VAGRLKLAQSPLGVVLLAADWWVVVLGANLNWIEEEKQGRVMLIPYTLYLIPSTAAGVVLGVLALAG
jgi:hypothetical protein